MISFLKGWINQIIVSIIIATILEIIIPDGNNKKYIKMIIGIYVLFTIIEPITTKVFGKNIDISNFDYSKYFESNTIISETKFEENNSKLIEETYIENIKNDIESKIKQKGYEVESCDINIINNENDDEYGNINKLNLKISKGDIEEKKEVENTAININKINIENNNYGTEVEEKITISEDNINELKKYLSNEYSIDLQKINITN